MEFAGTMREELVWIENLMLAAGKGCLLDVNGPMFFGAGVRRLSDGGAGPGNGARLMELLRLWRLSVDIRAVLVLGTGLGRRWNLWARREGNGRGLNIRCRLPGRVVCWM